MADELENNGEDLHWEHDDMHTSDDYERLKGDCSECFTTCSIKKQT